MTTVQSAQPAATKYDVRQALKSTSPWIERLARFGYAAKGVVYCLIGILALLSALGWGGGETTGSRGVLQRLLEQPFGRVLVGVLAVGLAGYAIWCFIQAIEDPEQEGTGAKGIAKRAVSFGKGVIYFSLVFAAVSMVVGYRSGGGEDGIDKKTATLMSFPFGIWLVGIVGLSIIVYGLRQLYRAWKVKLDDQLNLYRLSPGARASVLKISRFGIGARGVVFGVIGVAMVIAAYHANPSEAKGVGEALATVREQPYGPWLLGLVALGLIAYGVYEFVRAKYRRIDPA